MKFRITFLLTFISVICFAQGKKKNTTPFYSGDTIIVYDFLKPDVPGNFRIKYGTNVQFKIKNVNRSLYNFSFNKTEADYHTDVPEIFSGFATVSLPESSGGQENSTNPGYALTRDPFWERIKIFNDRARIINDITQFQNSLKFILKNCSNNYEEIKTTALVAAENYYSHDPLNSIPEAAMFVKAYTEKKLLEIKMQYDTLKEVFEAGKNKLIVLKAKLKELTSKIDSEDSKNKSLTESLKNLSAATDDLKEEFDQKQAAFEKATAINEQVKTFENTNGSENMADLLLTVNENNFIIFSSAYEAKSDEMNVEISIDPKENTTCKIPYENFKKTITGTVKGGWKLDFSTGLFLNLSFGDKNFFDQTYKLDSVPGNPDQKKIVKNPNRNITIPSVGALLHIYRRSGTSFNWGGTLGLSITNQTKLSYHGGLSGIMGTKQRIVLSTGLTLTQSNLLASKYEVNQVIPADPVVDPIPTENFYRMGWFFSFSYNLTGN